MKWPADPIWRHDSTTICRFKRENEQTHKSVDLILLALLHTTNQLVIPPIGLMTLFGAVTTLRHLEQYRNFDSGFIFDDLRQYKHILTVGSMRDTPLSLQNYSRDFWVALKVGLYSSSSIRTS